MRTMEMAMRKCNHKMTRYDWGRDAKGAETAIAHWCIGCGERLGLGPANDSVKPVPLPRREMADYRNAGWTWDPSRPIAEQLAETARDDAEADALVFPVIPQEEFDGLDMEQELAIQAMENAMEYEATRDAEPDCRDEDDDDIGPTPRATMPDPVVCSCRGDALGFETCADYEKWRDFDPFATTVPGDFGGPHGDIP